MGVRWCAAGSLPAQVISRNSAAVARIVACNPLPDIARSVHAAAASKPANSARAVLILLPGKPAFEVSLRASDFRISKCWLGMLRTELWASNKAPSALTASLALVSAHTACARGACALLVALYRHVPVSPCHCPPRRCAAVPLRSHVRRRVATRQLG